MAFVKRGQAVNRRNANQQVGKRRRSTSVQRVTPTNHHDEASAPFNS